MLFYAIRQIFLKGGTIKDAIYHVFKTTGKMPTKSEGKKIINVYQDVQKNTGKVFDLSGKRIDTSKPIMGGKNVKSSTKEKIFKIDDELEKISAGEGKYAKMSRNERENLMIRLQDESSTLQDKTLFKDSPEAIAKIKADNKAAVESLKKKKIKSKEPVGLFANEQEFAEELDSIRRNLIQNDPDFNLEIAESYLKPGSKTYTPFPDKEPGKLLSPKQRQKVLDNIKDVMKHDEYQHQFGEDFDFTKITDDMFRTEKASGGLARVGMFLGGGLKLKKFLLNKKTVRKAVDDIFPTGDYKYDAEMAAEALVENNPKFFKNKLYDDLSDADRMEVYGSVLSEVQNDLAKMLQTRRLSKPTKTLEGLKKEGTIDISNPEVADEFSRFMRESDPKGYKDLEQKVDLSNLDIKGKKGHASGGIAGQLHLNRPGYKSGLLVKLKNLLKPKPKREKIYGVGGKEIDVADLKKKIGLDAESLKKDDEAFKLRLQQILAKHSTKHAEGGIAGQLHMNEGGRVPMIFGGSAGLKAMIASIKAGLNKGRTEKIKTLFPKYSVEDKEILRLGEKYLPQDSATLSAREIEAKAEGIQILINRLKHDKKLIAEQAKNKAKNDPNLDFLMESLETTMPEAYGPHLKKYTNIDKDILQLETIKKNLIMKDRKLNAEGGLQTLNRPGYAGGTKKKKKEEAIIDSNYIPSTLEEMINAIKIKPRASGSFTEGAYGPENEQRTWTDEIGAEATVDLPWGFELKGDYDKRRIKDRLYSPDDEYLDERVRADDDRWKLELLWKHKFGKGGKKLNQGGRVSLSNGGLANILGV